MPYRQRPCSYCGESFQPGGSKHKHCTPECRFKEIAAPFKGTDGCWEWPLSRNPETGYGQFMVRAVPMTLDTAHRYSYQVFVGPIPPGLLACHSCDNPGCFNPEHLFAGTYGDNVRDMFDKGRQQDYVNCGFATLDRHRLNRIRRRILAARVP